MNYWLLTTEFPPIHGGGISTYCWHTANMLSEAGHAVSIFTHDYSINSIIRESPIENVELIRFNPNQEKKGEALGLETRLALEFASIVEKEIENKGAPDVIETQDYLGIGYYIQQKKYLLYPNFKSVKILVTIHAPSFLYLDYNQVPYYKYPTYWIGEMEKASIAMADLVISPSEYLIAELGSIINIQKSSPIHIFNPYKEESSFIEITPYEKDDIVFFGKLTPQKGPLEMLSYLKKMWDNGFKNKISIIGGGNHFFYPIQKDMILHIKEVYFDYIKKGLIVFEGNLPPNKLKARLKKAHVIIIPSIVDNLPYAVLEAMAMGKIVLTSKNGGHTEIMNHGHNGFIFSHEIPNSFNDQLTSILELNLLEIEQIGKNAQKSVKETTNYKTIIEQKTKSLSRLLEKNLVKTQFPFINTIKRTNKSAEVTKKIEAGKLSIVIPYYNMGEFIEDTLASLENISYKNYEILLINDGSSEQKSINKIEDLEKKYNITIYHKPNEGLSLTRNFGAEKSTGEFLAFLDADDTVSTQYYKRAIDVLSQYDNVGFIGCWAQYFGESSDIWPTFNPEPPYLLLHNMINSSALVYKRNDFLRFGKNDPKLIYGMEDYDSLISMVKNGARGLAFPELWWQYRIRKNSMAQSFTKNKELYLYKIINRNHRSFFKLYGDELVNLLNHNGPGINYDNPTRPVNEFIGLKSWLNSGRVVSLMKKNKQLRSIAKKIYSMINR